MAQVPGVWKNVPTGSSGGLHFKRETQSSLGKNATHEKWIVAYDGKLPFRYVSRELPSSVPPLFSVVFKAVTDQPVHARAPADARKAIDFAAPKNMLGKEPGSARAVP